MKFKIYNLRKFLVSLSVVISYVVFTVFGVIITKYNPVIINYVDLTLIPIGLLIILIFFLFTFTIEEKINLKLDDIVLKCAKLYGEGKSFNDIQDELGLNNLNEVKRMITEFCKNRS